MKKKSLIFVAGHNGMVGSAIVKNLKKKGYVNILTKSRKELDLLNQDDVFKFFKKYKPEYVFLGAAKVGGIIGNRTYPAEFIYENLVVETNVIHASHVHKVKKLLFLGSSCIYPKLAPQPMNEDALLTSPLEPTNEYYAIAKIAGLKLCEAYKKQYGDNFISAMPTNLYGPKDNYHPQNSHVIPGMLRKFHEAKQAQSPSVTVWGTGKPKREFLHVDDLADACVFLMKNYNDSETVNIGTGTDISIKALATEIKKVTGFTGKIIFDTTKPDGTPRKLLNVKKLHKLGWKHAIDFKTGIKKTYNSFLEELSNNTIRK
jgi:GDP-L-fucose synthase